MIGYWAFLTFGGNFTPDGNFAEKIDRAVLGRVRDGVYYAEDGSWHFSDGYRYTWVLTSMVFGVTTIFNRCLYFRTGSQFQKYCQFPAMGIRTIYGRLLWSFTNLCQFHDSISYTQFDV